MKVSRFLRFYWITFLIFPVAFFRTNYASVFEDGRWIWQDAPGFDTATVKAGYIPIKYYVFGLAISQGDYYLLELAAFFSVLSFVFYFGRFCLSFLSAESKD